MRACCAALLLAFANTVVAQPPRPTELELRTKACDEHDYLNLTESAFYWERQVRAPLRSLLKDPQCVGARQILALIAEPADIKLILDTAPPKSRRLFGNRWTFSVATALLEPRSDKEWQFLRACALNRFEDRWADAGAIQSLKLIASPRSLQILSEAQKRNRYRATSLAKAVEYVKSGPPPLMGEDLNNLAERTAEVVGVGVGRWVTNRNTRYNEAGDKALVDFEYDAGADWFIYTATFHRLGGAWTLRGVRATLQEEKAPSVVLPPPLINSQPPPQLPPAPPLDVPDAVQRPAPVVANSGRGR